MDHLKHCSGNIRSVTKKKFNDQNKCWNVNDFSKLKTIKQLNNIEKFVFMHNILIYFK